VVPGCLSWLKDRCADNDENGCTVRGEVVFGGVVAVFHYLWVICGVTGDRRQERDGE
jgi:hypothetical protein